MKGRAEDQIVEINLRGRSLKLEQLHALPTGKGDDIKEKVSVDDQKDPDQHIGNGRVEIGAEFFPGHRPDLLHKTASSSSVSRRNTSSSVMTTGCI